MIFRRLILGVPLGFLKFVSGLQLSTTLDFSRYQIFKISHLEIFWDFWESLWCFRIFKKKFETRSLVFWDFLNLICQLQFDRLAWNSVKTETPFNHRTGLKIFKSCIVSSLLIFFQSLTNFYSDHFKVDRWEFVQNILLIIFRKVSFRSPCNVSFRKLQFSYTNLLQNLPIPKGRT